jgi:Ca2+-binding RTX toxin-like protein
MKKRVTTLSILILAVLILLSTTSALTAGNIVPVTFLSSQSFSISISDLAPSACAGLNLTNIVYASGLTFGTNGNDLILGSGNGETIFGLGGDDCIVAGGGDDILLGGGDTDVCIGGPGSDSFQFFIFGGCETEIQ